METQYKLLFFIFFSAYLPGNNFVQGSSLHSNGNRVGLSKLFVFGDSYADTGNRRKGAGSWTEPYGTTFPGKPAGRYSDGRVFTDYIASYLRIRSPIPYRLRKYAKESLRYGMNFAYGGTGVFDTYAAPEPNMTTQIDFLQGLIKDGVYTKHDLSSSIAHVSVAGNDYITYTSRNGTTEGMPAFITTVVNQLIIDLTRIHGLGVRKVTVTSLPPVGCLPSNTIPSSFKNCDKTQNTLADFHNQLLQEGVAKLNNSTKDSAFAILDLNTAFLSVIKSKGNNSGSFKFKNPLQPCCIGINSQYSCGDTDQNGVKQYTICKDPDSTFFWDSIHPSQQGWFAVYSMMRGSLKQLYN